MLIRLGVVVVLVGAEGAASHLSHSQRFAPLGKRPESAGSRPLHNCPWKVTGHVSPEAPALRPSQAVTARAHSSTAVGFPFPPGKCVEIYRGPHPLIWLLRTCPDPLQDRS